MRFKRMSVAVAAATMSASALLTGASPAGATTGDSTGALACYDGQQYFYKPSPGSTAPPGGQFVTGSSCADINVKLSTGAEVRVCFVNAGCQDDFKWAAADQWTVIATNVRDDVPYVLQFAVGFTRSGYVAD